MSGYRGRYGFTRDGIPTSDNLHTLYDARRSLSATVPDVFHEPAAAPPSAAAASSISSVPGGPRTPITIDNDDYDDNDDGDVEIIERFRRPRRRRRQRSRSPRPRNFSAMGQPPEVVPVDNNPQNII